MKRAALAEAVTLGPYVPTVEAHERLGDGEAHPEPLVAPRQVRLGLVKRFEDAEPVGGFEPAPGVAQRHLRLSAIGLQRELDTTRLGGERDRILQQVRKNEVEPITVS